MEMNSILPDEGARGWLHKFARKNYWRVASWIEFDDLVQDGFMIYYEVLQRYPTATDPAHRMRLFQLCFRSKIEDLVRANTKQVDDARSDLVEDIDNPDMVVPDSSNFNMLLAKAPKLVQDVIALMNDPAHRDELEAPYNRAENGRRESLNDRICRLLGLSFDIDALGAVRRHFAQ